VIDLIGRPYRYGADGTESDGAIDCIHLVLIVLDRLGIQRPQTRQEWYGGSAMLIGRDLLKWGQKIATPQYDGDVLLLPQETTAFAVYWENGCLYINQHLKAAAWCPIEQLPISRCFRSRSV